MDLYTEYVATLFDYKYSQTEYTSVNIDSLLPSEFNVGLLIRAYGSGKTKLLLSFLENLNIQNENPNLYLYKEDMVHVMIDKSVVIKMSTEDFERIKDYKLFIRSDTSTKPIFYNKVKENGKKGRIYLRDEVQFTVVE